MNEGPLPDGDHIVRYVKPSCIVDGMADGLAFRLRPGESALSVNWLEAFSAETEERVAAVRRVIRMELRKNGRFAELQVGEVERYLARHITISVVHRPLDEDGGFPADPSHAEMAGLPLAGSLQVLMIGDMIAECVRRLHPAVLEGPSTTGG